MLNPIRLDARNPGPMTGDGNHTYLLGVAAGAATLIDAGVGDPWYLDELAATLARHGASLERVLVTHGHFDHASGAPAILRAHPSVGAFKYPDATDVEHAGVPWRPLRDDETVSIAGEPLVTIHTPGHSRDHVVFWHAASRTAFTGDLVILGSSVVIQASRGGDLRQYLTSLERVRSLAPARLLPAHGPEVTNPDLLLKGYIEHRLMRERQVIDALAAGCSTVDAVAESIYDGLAPALLPAARENVRAHLDKLTNERRAVDEDGRWRLTAP